MRIPLDRQQPIPLYQQIEIYIRQSILTGTLPPEARLPPARQLAQDLGVSRITVENAYAALESEGLVARCIGSGTYVSPPGLLPPQQSKDIPDWPLWQQYAQNEARLVQQVTLANLEWGERRADLISFTGFGDSRQFRIHDFSQAIKEVLHRDGCAALELDDVYGYSPLRTTIAHILANQGVQAYPNSILITSGSQQSLALVAQLLLKPGDTVLVESPTYDRALDLFRANHLKVIGCPTDSLGMQVEKVEPLLQQHHPRLIYTIPNFQNPTGMCLSLPRRRQLIALADRYNTPVLEDDFVGELRYGGRVLPALKTLDPGGRVIYIGTFSKLLMPGLRVGFLVADGPVYDLLAQLKQVNDLATSPLIQRVLEIYVTVGRYQAQVRRLCQIYRKRRDQMIQSIRRYLPPGLQVVSPQGGLFIWVQLPKDVSSERLLPLALEEGVEYVPGPRFFPQPGQGERYFRLNYATQTSQDIDEGIRRLGQALQRLQRT